MAERERDERETGEKEDKARDPRTYTHGHSTQCCDRRSRAVSFI
jgi:hypothetical protein